MIYMLDLDGIVGKLIFYFILFGIVCYGLVALIDTINKYSIKKKEEKKAKVKALKEQEWAKKRQLEQKNKRESDAKLGHNKEYQNKWRQNAAYKQIYKNVVDALSEHIIYVKNHIIYERNSYEPTYDYELFFNYSDEVIYGFLEYDHTQERVTFCVNPKRHKFSDVIVTQKHKEAFMRAIESDIKNAFPNLNIIFETSFGGCSLLISSENYKIYKDKQNIF